MNCIIWTQVKSKAGIKNWIHQMQNMNIIYQSICYLMCNCYKTLASQAQSASNMYDYEWKEKWKLTHSDV